MALADMVRVSYERTFSMDELRFLQGGVRAASMEHKWDVFFSAMGDPHVDFVRAWTGQLWCVLPINVDTGTCTELFVDRDYMHRLHMLGATQEVIPLFELVLYHVVFQQPMERQFVFGEQTSMELWQWIGICCVPPAQHPQVPPPN